MAPEKWIRFASMQLSMMRPRRVGEILDAGIKIYLARARTLMGLTAVVVVPMQILGAIVLLSTVPSGGDVPVNSIGFTTRTQPVPDPAARLGASAVVLVIQLVAGSLVTAACVKAVSDTYLDHPTGIAASLRFVLGRLPAVIGTEILYFLGLALAFVCLIVPGVWLYAAWSVAVPSLIIERRSPLRALGRSRRLVKGRWWPTAGVLLVSVVMVAVVSGVLQALLAAIAHVSSRPSLLFAVVVSTVSSAIASIIVQPFTATVATILYYDLRVRHEGYDLQLLADQLGLPPPPAAPSGQAQDGAAGAGGGPALGQPSDRPTGPESVGQPGGPPFWPPPPGWTPGS